VKTLHLVVHGRVQGVGFRFSLADTAAQFAVDGWVRNRRDGTVEALLRGAPDAVDAVHAWAQRGPPAARVTHVAARSATTEEAAAVRPGFTSLPTA
jgi:acylphosphatase